MEPTQTCEALAHEDKKAATVKKQAASKAAAGNSFTLFSFVTLIVEVLMYAGKATFNPFPDMYYPLIVFFFSQESDQG